MSKNVLIVSPDPGFGELIRLTLEDSGGYHAVRVESGAQAVQTIQQGEWHLAILDADTQDMPLQALAQSILEHSPDLPLIFILAEAQNRADFESFFPAGYLGKPFYLPDLEQLLSQILGAPQPASSLPLSSEQKEPPQTSRTPVFATPVRNMPAEAPPWLQDDSLAAQHLTRLSLESAAQAALINRQEKLWAYAGQLPQPAAGELSQAVTEIWNRVDDQEDKARFVRLESTGNEYMLYVTPLASDMLLALAFDVHTPFSKIHSQAGKLAKLLALQPTVVEEPSGKSIQTASSDVDQQVEPIYLDDDWDPQDAVEDANLINPMFEEIPPSIPTDWQPGDESSEGRQAFLEDLLSGQLDVSSKPAPAEPPTGEELTGFSAQDTPETEPTEVQDSKDERSPVSVEANLVDSLAETRPSTISTDTPTETAALKPVSPALYLLKYSCVLIPRVPEQYLVGDIARDLTERVRQLCIAFGWRLESISMRPAFLMISVDVPPNTSPGRLIRTLRQQTSRFLFEEFTRLKRLNPSGDFWAPGYLMTGGDHPPSLELIREYIHQTRQRQGVSNQHK